MLVETANDTEPFLPHKEEAGWGGKTVWTSSSCLEYVGGSGKAEKGGGLPYAAGPVTPVGGPHLPLSKTPSPRASVLETGPHSLAQAFLKLTNSPGCPPTSDNSSASGSCTTASRVPSVFSKLFGVWMLGVDLKLVEAQAATACHSPFSIQHNPVQRSCFLWWPPLPSRKGFYKYLKEYILHKKSGE